MKAYWCIVKFVDGSITRDSAGIVAYHFKSWELFCLLFGRFNTKVYMTSILRKIYIETKFDNRRELSDPFF